MIQCKLDDFFTYKSGREGEWLVIIFKRDRCYEAWLGHEDIGRMEYMFGCHEDDVGCVGNFINIVQHNLSLQIEIFEKEYENDLSCLRD